ncbi:PREDICTED: uncharacterized protein C15orf41 homolog [Ceratosolen solmsi marchali]|uniref:CDAN1-interacting nuclease 1 n=1 Tax=Ceratosolen solmsi marchali TaxID=326594 RepID=A0AAJ6YVS9_9HYME|nr:PREDICTED: uncharacterized protein C15orf41 homolog [Ceratosolen solmsi marchali]
MKLEEYKQIQKTINEFQGLSKDCSKMLITKYNSVHPNTLYSILSQEIQFRTQRTHHKVFETEKDYYEEYLDAAKKGEPLGIIIRMAVELNTCPALLARKVLEIFLDKMPNKCDKLSISKMMKDTTLISNKDLAYEIYLCVLYDDQYGAISNAISSSVGEEYEFKLERLLNERNIPYYNEDYLRTKGYDKTPDCKLEIPIAVNGFVINWIESKARFGSPIIHKKYIKEQFLSYWNRFGPGLVIYWFGFLDNIIQTSENRFIVMDHFPTNIIYMDPNSIK